MADGTVKDSELVPTLPNHLAELRKQMAGRPWAGFIKPNESTSSRPANPYLVNEIIIQPSWQEWSRILSERQNNYTRAVIKGFPKELLPPKPTDRTDKQLIIEAELREKGYRHTDIEAARMIYTYPFEGDEFDTFWKDLTDYYFEWDKQRFGGR